MSRVASSPERIFANVRVTEAGCWEWQGARMPAGYGLVTLAGHRSWLVHRLAWVLVNGPIPDGLCACHTCDNPPCINPEHLWLGSVGENNTDRHMKGRDAACDRSGPMVHPERLARGNRNGSYLHPEKRQGERHGRAKLTDSKVHLMRRLWGDGWTAPRLAAVFGVSRSTAWGVATGQTWTHIKIAEEAAA